MTTVHRPYGSVEESTLKHGDKMLKEIAAIWAKTVREHLGKHWKGETQSFSGAFVPESFADGGIWFFLVDSRTNKAKWETMWNYYNYDPYADLGADDNERRVSRSVVDDVYYEYTESIARELLRMFEKPDRPGWHEFSGRTGGTIRPIVGDPYGRE